MPRRKPAISRKQKRLSELIREIDSITMDGTYGHLNRILYRPQIVDNICSFFISNRKGSYNLESCASLYNRILQIHSEMQWENKYRVDGNTIHYPIKKIMKDLNWSNKKVENARAILTEWKLIDHRGRLENKKGLNEETRLIVVPFHKLDIQHIINCMTEINPESPFLKEFYDNVKNYVVYINNVKNNVVVSNTNVLQTQSIVGRSKKPSNERLKNKDFSYDEILKNKKLKITKQKQIPNWMNTEIEKLRLFLNSIRPNNPRYQKPYEVLAQANGLLEVHRKYKDVKLIRRVLRFGRQDEFWSQPTVINSYKGLMNPTKSGNKFNSMMEARDKELLPKTKTPTKKFNPKTLFKTKWDLDNFNKLLPKIDVDTSNGELKLLAENIMSFHKFYDSLPKHTKDNGGCYNSPWEIAEHYIDTVTKKFDSKPSFKILTSKHKMFKKYIYEDSRKLISADTNIGVDEDGNYIYRSTQ